MKYKNIAIAGAIVVGSQSGKSEENVISVQSLDKSGFDSMIIKNLFNKEGIVLCPTDFLKVSVEDEGKNIKFESLDQISIIVPRDFANGVGNKDFKN